MPARSFTATLATVLAAAVLLAGCSSDAEPVKSGAKATPGATPSSAAPEPAAEPEATGPYAGLDDKQILTLMSQTTDRASSVRVKADLKQGGDRIRMNAWMNRRGRAEGTLESGAEGSMTMIVIGRKGWLKPGPDMLAAITEGDPAVKEYMTGKWLPFTPDDPDMADQFELMSMKSFLAEMITPADLEGEIVRVKNKKFGKRAAIGFKREGEPGVLYVAADGSGELLAYTEKQARVRFSEWNSKHAVKKPGNVLKDDELA